MSTCHYYHLCASVLRDRAKSSPETRLNTMKITVKITSSSSVKICFDRILICKWQCFPACVIGFGPRRLTFRIISDSRRHLFWLLVMIFLGVLEQACFRKSWQKVLIKLFQIMLYFPDQVSIFTYFYESTVDKLWACLEPNPFLLGVML